MVEERNRSEIDDHKLLRAFLEEGEELLERLNAALLELEKDAGDQELVHEIFRLTHSLKSESALVGFGKLSFLAHRLEDVFERIRSGETAMSRPLMDAIFAASDLLHELMGRISRGASEAEVDCGALIAELEELAGLEPRGTAAGAAGETPGAAGPQAVPLTSVERFRILEALDRGHRVCRASFELDPDAAMRYPRAYLVFNNLEGIANLIKSVPDLTAPGEDDSRYARFWVLFTTDSDPEAVRRSWDVDQVRERSVEWWNADSIGGSDLALDAGADGVYPGAQSASGQLRTRRYPLGRRESAQSPRAASESTSVRVDTKKLNEMWQLVGDLVTWKARLSGLSDMFLKLSAAGHLKDEMVQVRDSLERITGNMQQAIMETSMVPIAVLFNKFPRLVRDLSRKLGKEVELRIEGRQTEIDRSFVEVLSDPLTHIIRNSLDHGIEPAQERLAAGKAAAGRITVSAQQLGGRILIDVTDDGRGLDVDKIRRKAGAPVGMADEEVIQYIFSPGFSTKEDVTDLSGRGVGMDVVATRIRGVLKGDVQVKSDPGSGTRVAIFLPLSLAILEALIIRCRGCFYAVAVRDIEETVRVRLETDSQGETVRYRDGTIPALRLERLLYGEPGAAQPAEGAGSPGGGFEVSLALGDSLMDASGFGSEVEETEHNGVVIRQKDKAVCLVVDQLVEEEDVVIKPVSDLLNNTGLFCGVSVLGDGRILFVLDTVRLVEMA